MLTWNNYYLENQRREDEIALAMQDRYIQSEAKNHKSSVTKLSIRMLDLMGKKLVEWGSQLQRSGAELAMTSTKRAI